MTDDFKNKIRHRQKKLHNTSCTAVEKVEVVQPRGRVGPQR